MPPVQLAADLATASADPGCREAASLVLTAPPDTHLRLLPAPACDPPYDDADDLRGRPPLHLVPAVARVAPAGRPRPRPGLPGDITGTGVHAGGRAQVIARPAWARQPGPDDGEPARTLSQALPASRPFAHALVQRLLEVCAGVRPLSQLRADTTPDLYDEIVQLLAHRPRSTAARPTRRDVRSVHIQERPEGVAEVCATVHRAGRAGALALRLEGQRGRWLCTQLLGL